MKHIKLFEYFLDRKEYTEEDIKRITMEFVDALDRDDSTKNQIKLIFKILKYPPKIVKKLNHFIKELNKDEKLINDMLNYIFDKHKVIGYDLLEEITELKIVFTSEEEQEQLNDILDISNKKLYHYFIDKLTEIGENWGDVERIIKQCELIEGGSVKDGKMHPSTKEYFREYHT